MFPLNSIIITNPVENDKNTLNRIYNETFRSIAAMANPSFDYGIVN